MVTKRISAVVVLALLLVGLVPAAAPAQTTGTIVIVKDTQPDSLAEFTFTGALGSFTLNGSTNPSRIVTMAPGSHVVTESVLIGWRLTGLACTDPDGGSTVSVASRTATIDLDAGETVTCTYTNEVQPSPEGPSGADTVGLVDPSQGLWRLRNTGGAVTTFFFGNPGDVPVMGDWDCDGIETPGLFRQSDAFAYLRNSNTQGIADIRFFFGNPSDVPLAGDFDGDGCDTLSIYRPDEQRFYIINELGEDEGGLGAADFFFTFGNPGDKPVVGDWDGDGIDEVGLHRESTGFFYYRTTLDTGIASGEFFFGDPDDRFVAGDWGIVDGKDSPAVFRPSNTTFFFRHTLTPGFADSQFVFGQSPWLPVAGAFGLG